MTVSIAGETVNELEEKSPQLSRRERKKRELHRRILRAAARLFAEKGYDGTTVDDIAQAADVAKGTFFNYFARKESLLAELAVELLEDLEEELGPPDTWRGSRRQQILWFYTELGERVHRDPRLFKVIVVENMRILWMQEEEETESEIRSLTRDLLERAIEQDEFPRDSAVEAAIKLIEAAYATATIESLRSGAPVAEYRRELATRLNIIFRGLGGEPVAMEGLGEDAK